MPDDKTPKLSPIPAPPRTPGARTREIQRAEVIAERERDEAEAARKETKEARNLAFTSVKEAMAGQIATLKEELAKERNRSKVLMRVFIAMTVLVLAMLGSAVGVVSSGTVSVPGIGTIVVGNDDDEAEAEVGDEPEEEAPEDVLPDMEPLEPDVEVWDEPVAPAPMPVPRPAPAPFVEEPPPVEVLFPPEVEDEFVGDEDEATAAGFAPEG
jgi:hypothetical protein